MEVRYTMMYDMYFKRDTNLVFNELCITESNFQLTGEYEGTEYLNALSGRLI